MFFINTGRRFYLWSLSWSDTRNRSGSIRFWIRSWFNWCAQHILYSNIMFNNVFKTNSSISTIISRWSITSFKEQCENSSPSFNIFIQFNFGYSLAYQPSRLVSYQYENLLCLFITCSCHFQWWKTFNTYSSRSTILPVFIYQWFIIWCRIHQWKFSAINSLYIRWLHSILMDLYSGEIRWWWTKSHDHLFEISDENSSSTNSDEWSLWYSRMFRSDWSITYHDAIDFTVNLTRERDARQTGDSANRCIVIVVFFLDLLVFVVFINNRWWWFEIYYIFSHRIRQNFALHCQLDVRDEKAPIEMKFAGKRISWKSTISEDGNGICQTILSMKWKETFLFLYVSRPYMILHVIIFVKRIILSGKNARYSFTWKYFDWS